MQKLGRYSLIRLLEADTDGSGDLSPDELRDLADDLEGESEFAATAAEEAERINQQVQGAAYSTDQEYWEKVGISTGEDLAKSVLAQTYSDTHREIYGVRPASIEDRSVEEIQAAIKSLDDDWYEMRHYDDQAWKDDDPKYIARGKAIEAEYEADKTQLAAEEELERMLTPEAGEDEPKRMGMGRRPLVGPARDVRRGRKISENKMKITRGQLRQIIKEEIQKLDEVPKWRQLDAARRGIPHPGSHPGPKYGEGNLTITDVQELFPSLLPGEQDDIWEKYKHLNNAGELKAAILGL
jgi:hypothetical protein